MKRQIIKLTVFSEELMKMYSRLVFCTVFFCHVVDSANILAIFPIPVRSHFVMTRTIVNALAAKGHDIDLYTIFPEEKVTPRIHHHQIPDIKLLNTPISVTDLRAMSVAENIEIMFTEEGNGNDICEKIFNADMMKDLRKSKKHYDLILLEIFVVDCFFGFAHVFKSPVVAFTSSIDLPWGSYRIGNLDNPSYIPTYSGEFGSDMTIYERILNTLTLVYAKYRHRVHLDYQEKLAKKFFGEDLPPINEIVSNTSLMLVNSHFSLNQPRPTVPNFVEVAGIHIREPKQVPKIKEIQKAASAVFTYLVSYPEDKTMLATLKYYSSFDGVDLKDITNFEAKDYVYMYSHGIAAYEDKDWKTVINYMEESLVDFLQSEEECRAQCEGPFDHGWLPDFIPSIANHFTYTLKCKSGCYSKLNSINTEKQEDLLPSHYHYLQYAYYKAGNLRMACEAVASFLLFVPGDETMLSNKEYYMKLPKVEKDFFRPRKEALRYMQRLTYEKKLMKFIAKEFNFHTLLDEDVSKVS